MLGLMRRAAHYLGKTHAEVHIEMCYREVIRWYDIGLKEATDVLDGAAGSVFKDGFWVPTGRYVRATMNVRNHAREHKVWRLKDASA